MEYKANPVRSGGVAEINIEEPEAVKATGVFHNAAAEQRAVGIVFTSFHGAGDIVSVRGAELKNGACRHIFNIRECQIRTVLYAAQLNAVCVFFLINSAIKWFDKCFNM